ncbi:glycosyltransferase family 2 protein [Pantoea sp. GD03673]|uniref:glycosyltransferase family 2 protein n=1 Tax=Pantoea sp. GD03673 TaxID=2975364 RepID=UPI00244948D2|nr:glycosyltransferase family 2 protein [Pantoea sp. GD03673]MDH2066373.1 glycosyltransferase family 2 protein [Pantoea sp. GD03673]
MKIIASLVLYRHELSSVSKTIDSLNNEKCISKIVIVDNGGYCSWLDSLCMSKVEIIRLEDNKGFGSGHNAVFDKYKNKSEFFLICNPDIVFKQGQVDALYCFSHQNAIGLSIPKIVYPDGKLQYSCKLLPTPYQLFMRRFFFKLTENLNSDYELHHADYSKPFFAPSLSGCFMLIDSKVLSDVRGFDTRYFLYLEDVDLSRRIAMQSNVSYFPGSVVVHESQRRSYTDIKFLFYHAVSAIKYFNKWGWFRDKQRNYLNKKALQSVSSQ